MKMINMPDGSFIAADLICGILVLKAIPQSAYMKSAIPPRVNVLYLNRAMISGGERSLLLYCKTNVGAKRLAKRIKAARDQALFKDNISLDRLFNKAAKGDGK